MKMPLLQLDRRVMPDNQSIAGFNIQINSGDCKNESDSAEDRVLCDSSDNDSDGNEGGDSAELLIPLKSSQITRQVPSSRGASYKISMQEGCHLQFY